ncbi:MAG: DUF4175 family protein [Cyclobacteriaceae bacterium]
MKQASTISTLLSAIQQYKKRYFLLELLKGILFCLLLIGGTFLVFNSIEYIGHFGSTVRSILFYGFLILGLCSIGYFIFFPLINYFRASSLIEDEDAARNLGDFFPEIKDRLTNVLQLSSLSEKEGELLLASIEQKSNGLDNFSFTKAISFVGLRKYSIVLVAFLLVLLSAFLIRKDFFTESIPRIINYNKAYLPKAPFEFVLTSSNLKATKNEDFLIELELVGDAIPSSASIIIQNRNYYMKKESNGFFSFVMENIQRSESFHFESSGFSSSNYMVEVIEKPSLTTVNMLLTFPSYQKRNPEVVENIGSTSVPKGAWVEWRLSTEFTDSVFFKFEAGGLIAGRQIKKGEFNYKKRILTSTKYSISMANDNSTNDYELSVINDGYPSIDVKEYVDSALLNYILFTGEIADDYGFSKMELHYEVKKENELSVSRDMAIPIKLDSREQAFTYELFLDTLGLEEGSDLEYSISVWDNDGVMGPKKTTGGLSKLNILSKKELNERVSASNSSMSSSLEKQLAELQSLQEELKELQDKLKVKKKLDWQDKKAIEKMIAKQQELEKRIATTKEKFKENSDLKNKLDTRSEQTDKNSKALEQMLTEEDIEKNEILEELKKLLQEKNADEKIKQNLEKLANENNSEEQQLNRSKELYKKLLFDEKLDKVIRDSKELADKQKDLAEDNEKLSNEEEAKQQNELKKEFEALSKEIESLEKLNKSLERSNDLKASEEEQNTAKESMEKANKELNKGDGKKANKEQQKAEQSLNKISKKMKSMQQGMQKKVLKENIETLKIILDNLLKLSFRQEEVMNEMASVSIKEPLFVTFSQQQLQLNENSIIVKDSLLALAKRAEQISNMVLEETNKFIGYMEASMDLVRKRDKNRIGVKQQYAMTSMNNLALLLSDILDNMSAELSSAQSNGSRSESMPMPSKGNKPGEEEGETPGNSEGEGESGKGKGSGSGLGDKQKGIGEGIKQLSNGQKYGRQLSEQLAKLAGEQEKLRNAIRQLEKEGLFGENSDNLSKIKSLMKQNEEDLVFKKVDSETIKRQEELLVRLLEAEEALKKQGESDEREAESGSPYKRKFSNELEKILLKKNSRKELLKTIPVELKPYYKNKVNEYFKKIDK